MDNFEKMLSGQNNRTYKANKNLDNENNSNYFKSNKSCTLYEFVSMINKIVSKTMKGVVFETDEGKEDIERSDVSINNTYITYKLIERVPVKEVKPAIREYIDSVDKDDDRIAEVYGQRFKNTIQFNIFSSTCEQVEKALTDFEDLLLIYAGFFEKNGIKKILFLKQLTDDTYSVLRQKLSIRNVMYYVETESIRVIFKERINEVESFLREIKEE